MLLLQQQEESESCFSKGSMLPLSSILGTLSAHVSGMWMYPLTRLHTKEDTIEDTVLHLLLNAFSYLLCADRELGNNSRRRKAKVCRHLYSIGDDF